MRIDAFPFNDELDMLELRLMELDSVVDVFVLVETGLTYRGDPKPLYYANNMNLFSKWNHKIVAVDSHTPKQGAWYFEQEQRNVLANVVRGLGNDDDTITFSDCDEIPNPKIIADYTPSLGLRNLKQYTYFYNYNCLMNYGRREWSRARIGTVRDFLHWGPYEFRQGPRDLDHSHPSIEDGGWHGSYFSITLDRMRRKVHSISHDDLDHLVDTVSDASILNTILNREDLYHRAGIGNGEHIVNPDLVRHPKSYVYNQERFKIFSEAHYLAMVGKVSTQNENPNRYSQRQTPDRVEERYTSNVVSSDPSRPVRRVLLPRERGLS